MGDEAVHNFSSQVSGQHENASGASNNALAALLDAIMKRNIILRQENLKTKLEASCETEKCTFLNLAVAAALQEGKALEEEREQLILTSQRGSLRDQFENLKSQLPQDEDWKQRHLDLEIETNSIKQDIQRLREEISCITQKIVEEESWKKKCLALEVTERVLNSEKEQLLEHARKVTKEYDVKKVTEYEFKRKVQRIEDLRRFNSNIQKEIDDRQEKLIDLQAMSCSYKLIDKDTGKLEAINKTLAKKRDKLYHKLLKYASTENVIERVKNSSVELITQNYDLNKEIITLNQEIEDACRRKVDSKTLREENKALMKRKNNLEEEICKLKVEKEKTLTKVQKKNRFVEENENARRVNEQLQEEYMEVCVQVYCKDLATISSSALREETEGMERLNQELRKEIAQLRESSSEPQLPSCTNV